jgi:hypothetical protein
LYAHLPVSIQSSWNLKSEHVPVNGGGQKLSFAALENVKEKK